MNSLVGVSWCIVFCLLPPCKRSLSQGNVFTPVCQSPVLYVTYPVYLGGCFGSLRMSMDRVSAPLHAGIHPPQADTHPPPPLGFYGIQPTSGRYASYWNAYFFFNLVHIVMCFFLTRNCKNVAEQLAHLANVEGAAAFRILSVRLFHYVHVLQP